MKALVFNQSYFTEAINGFVFILATFAVSVFVRWIWTNRKDKYAELRPALAISAVFLGDIFIRFSFWWARHLVNVGSLPNMTQFYVVASIGSIIQAWGILCCMYVFAPDRCSIRVWLYALACAILWNVFWMWQFFF